MSESPAFDDTASDGLTPDGPVRLIVKGDDMGAGHGVNVATIDAYRNGVLTTTNVIVPGPWFLEAVELLDANPGLDVGVHLALTSEWSRIRWRPITRAASLVDADGFFPSTVHEGRPGFPPGSSLAERPWVLDDIEAELRAQLDIASRHLPQATYTWAHMGFDMVHPSVHELVRVLTAEYGLVDPADMGIQRTGNPYEGSDSGEVKAEKLAARFAELEPGLWLHIDHAATDTSEMLAYGHTGYENVAADRSANAAAWTSPRVRAAIEHRGIRLTNYRDLTAADRPIPSPA